MAASEDELQAIIGELLSSWDQHGHPKQLRQPAARKGRKFTGSDAARITAVLGLSRHVYETVRAACVLVDQGYVNAAIPLVRVTYECAMSAAWLVQSKDEHGIKAFLHEHTRQRAAVQRDAAEASSSVFRNGAASVADTDTALFADSFDSTRQFQQVCMDLAPGGKDAFILYRALSSYSHASLAVTDLYFGAVSEGEVVPAYRRFPDTALGAPLLLFLCCASMIWAGRALNYLTDDKTHRSILRSAARAIEVNPELQLSEHYYQRHAKLKQATTRN